MKPQNTPNSKTKNKKQKNQEAPPFPILNCYHEDTEIKRNGIGMKTNTQINEREESSEINIHICIDIWV